LKESQVGHACSMRPAVEWASAVYSQQNWWQDDWWYEWMMLHDTRTWKSSSACSQAKPAPNRWVHPIWNWLVRVLA